MLENVILSIIDKFSICRVTSMLVHKVCYIKCNLCINFSKLRLVLLIKFSHFCLIFHVHINIYISFYFRYYCKY